MYNYDKGIFIDLSSFSDKTYKGLKFKSLYFTNAITDIIDSMEEGQLCDGCQGPICNNCNENCNKKYDVYIFVNNETKSYLQYVNNIVESIKSFNRNLNVELNIVSYDTIYELSKKFRNIILSSNIITYFAVNQNVNDVEDLIVIGYHFGLLKSLDSVDVKFYNSLYFDSNKFYISNPLMKSEFISYTDLEYLL